MRKLAIALLVIGLARVSAFGGIITFVPDSPTVDVGAGDSPLVTFDVFLGELGAIGDEFGSFEFVFGSGVISAGDVVGLELVRFVYDSEIVGQSFFPPSTLDNVRSDIYLDDITAGIFINHFRPGGPVLTDLGPVRIGSLTVDTTGLADGKYQVIVDANLDQQSVAASRQGFDLLFGVGSIHVVPEHATISLLGLASLALIRRRRAA